MTFCHKSPATRSQRGFGLLEVMVSLVIFAGVGLGILSWYQQSISTVQRLNAFYDLQEARKTVVEIAHSINPSTQPRGTLKTTRLRIEWEAQPLGEDVAQTGLSGGTGRFRLRLYDTRFSVYAEARTEAWFTETITLIGYRPVVTNSFVDGNG